MHEPVGRVQFVVFEKFPSADLSQIAREKSCDYLLMIHIIHNIHTELPSFVNPNTATEFKALCHALSGAFILIQLHGNELKSATSIQSCNLPSLRAVAKENPRLVAFSSFVERLLCCPNVQLLVY